MEGEAAPASGRNPPTGSKSERVQPEVNPKGSHAHGHAAHGHTHAPTATARSSYSLTHTHTAPIPVSNTEKCHDKIQDFHR